MHLQNPLLRSLFFLAVSTLTTCTDLSIPSPLSPTPPTLLLRSPPKAFDPLPPRPKRFTPRPFTPPACSPPHCSPDIAPSYDSATAYDAYLITCGSLFPSEFHCTTPDRDCTLHTNPIGSRKRKNLLHQTPITTGISRTLPLRCSRNCFCDDFGQVNCGNDKRFIAAERDPRFVLRLTSACQPICSCEKWETEGGEEVSSKSANPSPRHRGSESPPHRGVPRPHRVGFLSPEPEGLRSPPHRGRTPPMRGFQSPERADFMEPEPAGRRNQNRPPASAHGLAWGRFQSRPPVPLGSPPRAASQGPSGGDERSDFKEEGRARKKQKPGLSPAPGKRGLSPSHEGGDGA
ncbi:hypothetical protein MMC30_002645 [Trapelia coarctata]|nr:hypothetical protein [Trapelia coarctata]